MSKRKRYGYIAATLAVFLIASYSVLGKNLLETASPISLAAISQGFSIVSLLFVFGTLPEYRKIEKLKHRHWPLIIIVSLLSAVVGPVLLLEGLSQTTATNAVLVGRIEPVLATLIAGLWLREKISSYQMLGIVLMFLGVAYISSEGFAHGISFTSGNGLILLAAGSWALATNLYRRYLRTVKPEIMVLLRNIIGAVVLILAIPLVTDYNHDFSFLSDSTTLVTALIFSVCSIALAQWFWYYSLERIRASHASIIGLLSPLFGVILAVIILSETVESWHLIGGLLVVGGLAMTVVHHHKHSKHHGILLRFKHHIHHS